MTGSIMRTVIDMHSSVQTSEAQAFDAWEAALSAAYFPMRASPMHGNEFHASIATASFEDLTLIKTEASGQTIRRTRRLVAATDQPFVVATCWIVGDISYETEHGSLEYTPGTLIVTDTDCPYNVGFRTNFTTVSVQAPLPPLLELAGLSRGRLTLPAALPASGPGSIIAQFFSRLMELEPIDPGAAAILAGHGYGLLASALQFSIGRGPQGTPADEFARQRAVAFIRRHYTDPELTVDQIAFACNISRRTLYRLFPETGGLVGMVRTLRIDHARSLLREHPARPLGVIAATAGFATERHFYRIFRQETGMTPGEYRAAESSTIGR